MFAFDASQAGQIYNTRITLPTLSTAMRRMREYALSRLREEAQKLGATGVVGVNLAMPLS